MRKVAIFCHQFPRHSPIIDKRKGTSKIALKNSHHFNRRAYDVIYDSERRQPRYVYQHLTAASFQGDVDRRHFDFQEDPLIPSSLRATNADYLGSGFDRGHFCPAADARFSVDAMEETFYLSNISPQIPQFNRGYWLKLERYVRGLTRHYGAIHVYTGGLYLPREENDGKRYVRYEVIGPNDVAVPTHFFKVIFNDDHSLIEAFILPNEEIAANMPLKEFQATIEKVERAAGIIFHSLIP